MSNILIGISEQGVPSQALFEEKIESALRSEDCREALFDQGGLVMMSVSPRYDAGFFLCREGVIRPKAFEAMIPAIVSQPDLLRGFAQDSMRMMLRDQGITVKIHDEKLPEASTPNDAESFIFLKVSSVDIVAHGAKEAYTSVVQWLSSKPIKKHAVVINGIMIEPVSRITDGMIRLHSAGGDSECIATMAGHYPLYGEAIRVEGMSENFREFWHLNYLLSALGSRMEIKRMSTDADITIKTAIKMSHILAA